MKFSSTAITHDCPGPAGEKAKGGEGQWSHAEHRQDCPDHGGPQVPPLLGDGPGVRLLFRCNRRDEIFLQTFIIVYKILYLRGSSTGRNFANV